MICIIFLQELITKVFIVVAVEMLCFIFILVFTISISSLNPRVGQ